MVKKVPIKNGKAMPAQDPMYLSKRGKDEVEWDNADDVDYPVVFENNDSPFKNKHLTVKAKNVQRSGDIDPEAHEGLPGYKYNPTIIVTQ